MPEPLIFFDRYGLKPDSAEAFTALSHRVVDVLESNPTRHLYFAHCITAQGTGFRNVQVHPDPQSMVEHMALVASHIQDAGAMLDFADGEEDLYGFANESLREQLAAWGTRENLPADGFTRLGVAGRSTSVAEPLLLRTSYSIRPGAADGARAALHEWLGQNEAEHPRLLHHKVYVSADGTTVTDIQVHPDARSFETQLPWVAKTHGGTPIAPLEGATTHLEVVGTPTAELLSELRDAAGEGVTVEVITPTAGFSRLPSG